MSLYLLRRVPDTIICGNGILVVIGHLFYGCGPCRKYSMVILTLADTLIPKKLQKSFLDSIKIVKFILIFLIMAYP